MIYITHQLTCVTKSVERLIRDLDVTGSPTGGHKT